MSQAFLVYRGWASRLGWRAIALISFHSSILSSPESPYKSSAGSGIHEARPGYLDVKLSFMSPISPHSSVVRPPGQGMRVLGLGGGEAFPDLLLSTSLSVAQGPGNTRGSLPPARGEFLIRASWPFHSHWVGAFFAAECSLGPLSDELPRVPVGGPHEGWHASVALFVALLVALFVA